MKQDHYLQETKIAKFTTRVYGWMSIGLATTACIAYLVVHSGLYQALLPLWWVWSFITLGIGLGINYALNRLSAATMGTLFITYAVCEGLMFGTILPLFAAAYGGSMIWCAFATAAIIFTVAVIYGIYTKADMSSLGRIFTLGVIALFVLSLAYFIGSFFVPLKGMYLIISYIGLILFVGLTAYDAQNIRRLSLQADHSELAFKLSLMMALRMYINVVMIFWYLLQIFSSNHKK